MAGVTLNGFETQRLADIIAIAESQLETIVDDVTGDKLHPDFSGADPAMTLVKVPLDLLAVAWEMASLVVDQFNPNAAVGPSLQSLVLLNNLKVQAASRSFIPVTLTGSPNALIQSGIIVTDQGSAHQWVTREAVTLSGGGTATVTADCLDVGAITAAPNTLTRIVTNVPGLLSVTNTGSTSDAGAGVGRDAEKEEDLRRRRERSTSAPGFGPIEAIRANVANIPGVTYAKIYMNQTLSTDSRGITARKIAPVILGGDDTEVANVLMQRTGTTSDFYGTTTKTLYDSMGEPYVVRWTRPAGVQVYVKMDIKIDDSGLFPFDGLQQIRDNIATYAQGGARALGIPTGYDTSGFGPGSLIELTQLFTAINKVPGHHVMPGTLEVGLGAGTTEADDLQVPWNQYPIFTPDDVHIDINPV